MSRWNYQEYEALNGSDASELIRKKLTELTHGEANSAKFDVSDMTRKIYLDPTHPAAPGNPAARGLVVWFGDAPDAPVETIFPQGTGSTWSMYTWRTDHDYDSLYQGLVRAMQSGILPDGRPLPQASAWYSRIAFTNMMHGASTLTIFFRT